jgi:hypothetical protein
MGDADIDQLKRMLLGLQDRFETSVTNAELRSAKMDIRFVALENRMGTIEALYAAMPDTIRKVMREELALNAVAGDAEQFRALVKWGRRTFAAAASSVVLIGVAFTVNWIVA